MTKKIFLLCIAILLVVHGAASAKEKGLPEAERIKIALEVNDETRHKDLNSAALLEEYLASRLLDKNLVNVVNAKVPGETSANAEGIGNLGEILIFDAVEIPPPVETAANFDQQRYQNLGATYVVRCEVLALGLTKVDDPTLSTITGLVGSGISFAGSGNKGRDKTLRKIGTGINFASKFLDIHRTALKTVVTMQFIEVDTGKVLWQQNFVGEGLKHRSPGKEFDDIWTRALHESVDDTAKIISKRVNKYVDKVIIQGKSDEGFLSKDFSIRGMSAVKLF